MTLTLTPELLTVVFAVVTAAVGVIWRLSSVASRVTACEEKIAICHKRVDEAKGMSASLDRKIDEVCTRLTRIETLIEVLVKNGVMDNEKHE